MRTINQHCSAFCLWLNEKGVRIKSKEHPKTYVGYPPWLPIEGASSGGPQPWADDLKEIEKKHPIKED